MQPLMVLRVGAYPYRTRWTRLEDRVLVLDPGGFWSRGLLELGWVLGWPVQRLPRIGTILPAAQAGLVPAL